MVVGFARQFGKGGEDGVMRGTGANDRDHAADGLLVSMADEVQQPLEESAVIVDLLVTICQILLAVVGRSIVAAFTMRITCNGGWCLENVDSPHGKQAGTYRDPC